MSLLADLRKAVEESLDIKIVQEISSVNTKFALHDGNWDDPKFSNVVFYLAPKDGFYQLNRTNCDILAGMFERLVSPFFNENMPEVNQLSLGRRLFVDAVFREGNELVYYECYEEEAWNEGSFFIGGFYATECVGLRTRSPYTLSYEILPECREEFDETLWHGCEEYGKSISKVTRAIKVHLFPSEGFLKKWNEIIADRASVGSDVLLRQIGLLTYPNYEIDVCKYNRLFNN